jgi:hypothetical protein
MNQFKRAQIVILPHNNINTKITLYKDNSGKPLELSLNTDKLALHTNQHLYVISDDEMSENDFILTFTHAYRYIIDQIKEIHKGTYVSIRNELLLKESIKGKIISTTDTSLRICSPCIQCDGTGETVHSQTYNRQRKCDLCSQLKYPNTKALPQPSQQFIEKYIEEYHKGKTITDVLVEYASIGPGFHAWYDVKINSKDNTITIKKLKDSWNKEEVIEQMWLAYKAANTLFEDESPLRLEFDNWIDKNL